MSAPIAIRNTDYDTNVIDYLQLSTQKDVIVIDNGSHTIKTGLAQHETPSLIFPTVTHKLKYPKRNMFGREKYILTGDETNHKQPLTHPIKNGIITPSDWDHIEAIYHTIYEDLRIANSKEHSLLLTETTNNPHKQRSKTAELMFETFSVPSLYLCNQSVLCLYATGRLTGITVDSGYSVTHTVPIYEGFALRHAIMRMNVGGEQITDYLMDAFCEKGYEMDRESVREIKEKYGFVALDGLERELQSESEIEHVLPDGKVMHLGNELFRATELLFAPERDMGTFGIDLMTYMSVMKCSKGMRKDLFGNVVLAGNNLLFKGMDRRLEKELKALGGLSSVMKKSVNVMYGCENGVWTRKLIDKYSGKYCCDGEGIGDLTEVIAEYIDFIGAFSFPTQNLAWMGGAVFASTSAFHEMCVTKDEYEESGAAVLSRKCF